MHTLKRKKKEINLQPINKITSSTVHFFLFFFFFLFNHINITQEFHNQIPFIYNILKTLAAF